MSRSFTNATTGVYQGGVATLTDYPLTLACWMNFQSLPSVTGVAPTTFMVDIADYFADGLTVGIAVTTGNALGCFTSNAAGAFFGPAVIGSFSANTWQAAVFSCASATSRTQYMLSAGSLLSSSDTASCPLGTQFVNARMGGFGNAASPIAQMTGFLDNCAIWNVALTAGEAQAFCNGELSSRIRPQSLVNWWQLLAITSTEPDYGGSHKSATNSFGTSATFARGSPTMPFTPRWSPFLTPPAAVGGPFMVFQRQTLAIPLQTSVSVTLGVHS